MHGPAATTARGRRPPPSGQRGLSGCVLVWCSQPSAQQLSVLLTSAPDSKIPPSAPHFRTAGEIERTERSTPSSSFILFFPVCSRCLSAAAQDGVEETVCVSVLRLWQAVCSENGEPGFGSSPRSLREPHGTREVPRGWALEPGVQAFPPKKCMGQKQGLCPVMSLAPSQPPSPRPRSLSAS